MKYKIIYLDPPWTYADRGNAGKRGVYHKYKLMSDDEIKNIPINDIAAKDSILFLWTTLPKLPIAIEVIKSWGFTYKSIGFCWIKTNKIQTNKLFFGMGHYTRSNAEICLLAVKGKPKVNSHSVHSVVMAPIGKHSKKPDEVRDRIVQLMGDLSRIEIFSREQHDGWTCIGNEMDGRDVRIALHELIDDNGEVNGSTEIILG